LVAVISKLSLYRVGKIKVDHKKGFGGQFGVQSDRVDKSAAGYDSGSNKPIGTDYQRTKAEGGSEGAKNLKARFENLAQSSGEEDRKRAEEERARRRAKEEKEKEEARRREAERVVETESVEDTYEDAAAVSSHLNTRASVEDHHRRYEPEPEPEPEPAYHQQPDEEEHGHEVYEVTFFL
jgi:cortactin